MTVENTHAERAADTNTQDVPARAVVGVFYGLGFSLVLWLVAISAYWAA